MSTTIKLINTGIIMGIIHVLTGPDHLSALATLSGTNITSHKRLGSFLLGVKWGLGHSLGLLVVGGLLIAMEEEASEEDEWIGTDNALLRTFEWFVGVFMLLLGLYGIRKACRNRRDAMVSPTLMAHSASNEDIRRQRGDYDYEEDDYENVEDEEDEAMLKDVEMSTENHRSSLQIIEQMTEALNLDSDSMQGSVSIVDEGRGGGHHDFTGVNEVEARIYLAAESLRQNSGSENDSNKNSNRDHRDERFMNTLKKSAKETLSDSFVQILTKEQPTMRASQLVHKHAAPENSIALDASLSHHHHHYSSLISAMSKCCCCTCTPDILALLAGIVHGVAGPGGVLGVIPAVQLRDAKLASLYLSTFCLTSTLVMGCFAAFYGTFSEWLAGGGRRGRRGGCSRVFIVEVGSASLSIGVGIVWLVLLSVGKLQEMFP